MRTPARLRMRTPARFADAGSVADADAGSVADADAGSVADADAGSVADADAGSVADADAGSVADADAGSVADADAGSVADADAGSVAGWLAFLLLLGGGAVWRSSTRISSSRVFRRSFDARLNSPRLLPSERPSSGSFRGPKTISAMTRMTIISGMPIEPNMGDAPWTSVSPD